VEYITGMDTRIGYPNEHLAGDSDEEIASPLYATAVGLLMNALKNKAKKEATALEEQEEILAPQKTATEDGKSILNEEISQPKEVQKERKSIFDKWSDKLKDFLDNAE
ncbi:MAG: cell division protein FtsA, partial [Cellulophaga sp.]|nr:cell division protein FtsA [Cellulophaga sp.]